MHILGNIQSKHIRADPRVHKEYQRLRDTSLELNIDSQQQLEDTFESSPPVAITLLNIRSLRKHSIDIKNDARILDSDVLLPTETQLKPTAVDDDIRSTLHPFQLYRQDIIDKSSSLAMCFRNTVCRVEHEYFSSLNAVKFAIFWHQHTKEENTPFIISKEQHKQLPIC